MSPETVRIQNIPFEPAAMDDDNPWDRVGSGDNAKGLWDD